MPETKDRHSGSETRVSRVWLGFLHADLGLPQSEVARMLKVPQGAIAKAAESAGLRRQRPRHGEYPMSVFCDLAEILALEKPAFVNVDADRVWAAMRTTLVREVRRTAKQPERWNRLGEYIERLPFLLKAADSRLTKPRIELLHGDLGASAAEITTLLDASWSSVRRAIARYGVDQHSLVHNELLSDEGLDELARRLGLAEWQKEWTTRARSDLIWTAAKRETRQGLLKLVGRHRLDLAVLDRFIAEIPAINEQRRERMFSRAPALKKKAA